MFLGDGSIGIEEFRYDCVSRMAYPDVKVLDEAFNKIAESENLTLERYKDLYAQFLGNPDESCLACNLFGPLPELWNVINHPPIHTAHSEILFLHIIVLWFMSPFWFCIKLEQWQISRKTKEIKGKKINKNTQQLNNSIWRWMHCMCIHMGSIIQLFSVLLCYCLLIWLDLSCFNA